MLPSYAYHIAAKPIAARCPAPLCIHPTTQGDLLTNEYLLPFPKLLQDHKLQSQAPLKCINKNLRAADILHDLPAQGLSFLRCLILHSNFAATAPSNCSSIKPRSM